MAVLWAPFGLPSASHRAAKGEPQGSHRLLRILRVMASSDTASRVARTPMRRADGTPIRVLVVDDEATLTDPLSMALRYEGWEVKTAGDGRQALAAAREFKPAAIVVGRR